MIAPYLGWSPISWHAMWENNTWKQIEYPPAIHPASTSVQFGHSVIEGMKAYLGEIDSLVRVFRLHEHWQRLVNSCERLKLPLVPEPLFREALSYVLIHLPQWQQPLASNIIYIRPIVYSLDDHIFPIHGKRFGFSIYVAPVGSFRINSNYTLYVQNQIGRTANNGLGNTKTASNYAPIFAFQPKQSTFNNLLWLASDNIEPTIDEANTANIFFITRTNTLITPLLNQRILSGITRRSVIEIASVYNIDVEEQAIKIQDLCQQLRARDITGCFLTSTGCGVQPVHCIL